MDKEGILAYSDGITAQTPFGDIEIKISAVNANDLQKLRDIIINFYEGLACMCQNMGDECSTYGFYAEDRETSLTKSEREYCEHDLNIVRSNEICKHCNPTRLATICDLHGGNCEFYCNEWKNCAMYEPYPF